MRPADRSPRRRPMPAASISPTRAEHVLKSLGGRIPLIVDGGAVPNAARIRRSSPRPAGALRLLRPGPIDLDANRRIRRRRSRRPASLQAIMRRPSRSGSMPTTADRRRILDRLRRRSPAMPASAPRATWSRRRRACSTCCTRPTHRRSRASPSRRSRRGPRRGDQRPAAPRRGALGGRGRALQAAPGSSCAASEAWAG